MIDNMIDIQISRLIAAAIAAFLLGWACYVAAFVKHKNDAKDLANRAEVAGAEVTDWEKIRIERSSTWYTGYRLALLGLIVVSAAVGWAAAYLIGQEYALTWIEDAAIAAVAAVIGGMILDKYIIHPIADGAFFEKVEDPLVDYFLENGSLPVKEVKLSRKERKAAKKAEELEEVIDEMKDPAPPEASEEDLIAQLTFDEKVKLIEKLRKTL